MPLFVWNPFPTYVAHQINTLEDFPSWVTEITEAGLLGPKDGWTFSDFAVTQDPDNQEQFILEYTVVTEVDGQSQVRQKLPYGYWVIANSLYYINVPWFEDDVNFQRRFQPFNGLVDPEV